MTDAPDALVIAQQALADHDFGRTIYCYEAMTLKLCRALVASAAREAELLEALEEAQRRLTQAAAIFERMGLQDTALNFLSDAQNAHAAKGSDGK